MPRTILLCIVSILFNFSDSCAMRSESLPLPKSSFEANKAHHYYRAFPSSYLEKFQKKRAAFTREQIIFQDTQSKIVLFSKGIPWEIYKEYLEVKRLFDQENFRPTHDLYDVIFNPLLMDPRGAIPKAYQHPPIMHLPIMKCDCESPSKAMLGDDKIILEGLADVILEDENKARNWIAQIEKDALQMDVQYIYVTYERKPEYKLATRFLERQSFKLTESESTTHYTFTKYIQPMRFRSADGHATKEPFINVDPRIFHYIESLERFGVFFFVNGQTHACITGRITGALATIEDLSFMIMHQDQEIANRLITTVEKLIADKGCIQTKVSVPDFQKEFFRKCGYDDTSEVSSWK